jgi:hypothetical protein
MLDSIIEEEREREGEREKKKSMKGTNRGLKN